MSWLIALVVLIAGFGWLLWYARNGAPIYVGAVEREIIDLLKGGYEDGRLTLRIFKQEDRIQFHKYIRAPDDYGVKLIISERDMQPPRYQSTANFLRSLSGHGGIIQSDSDASRQSLELEFGTDTAEAARVLIGILNEVYGLSRDDSVRVRLDNISSGEDIDGNVSKKKLHDSVS